MFPIQKAVCAFPLYIDADCFGQIQSMPAKLKEATLCSSLQVLFTGCASRGGRDTSNLHSCEAHPLLGNAYTCQLRPVLAFHTVRLCG